MNYLNFYHTVIRYLKPKYKISYKIFSTDTIHRNMTKTNNLYPPYNKSFERLYVSEL